MLYRVKVLQGLRGRVSRILEAFCHIEEQGYTDGSTTWTFVVYCDIGGELGRRAILDAVWDELPSVSVEVEKVDA